LERKRMGLKRSGKDGVEVGSFGERAGVCIEGRRGEEDRRRGLGDGRRSGVSIHTVVQILLWRIVTMA
jgi:hypothetical protein